MAMIEHIARIGLPSQDGPGFGTPNSIRPRLITRNAGSSIHIKATVDRTVGTMNGNSSSARMMFLNLKSWFIASARPSPPTILDRSARGIDKGVGNDLPEHRVARFVDNMAEPDEGPGLGHRPIFEGAEEPVAERLA